MTPASEHPNRDIRQLLTSSIGLLLCTFTLVEVNYPLLAPQSRLAFFAMLGLVLCFLNIPLHPVLKAHPASRIGDLLLAALAVICCGYIFVQTDPVFESWWVDGQ